MGVLYEKVMKMRKEGRSFIPKTRIDKPKFDKAKNIHKTAKDNLKHSNELKEAVIKDDCGTVGKS